MGKRAGSRGVPYSAVIDSPCLTAHFTPGHPHAALYSAVYLSPRPHFHFCQPQAPDCPISPNTLAVSLSAGHWPNSPSDRSCTLRTAQLGQLATKDNIMPPKERAAQSHDGQSQGDGEQRPKIWAKACVTCRAKKIRCDALHPRCTPCIKQDRECSYRRETLRKRCVILSLD